MDDVSDESPRAVPVGYLHDVTQEGGEPERVVLVAREGSTIVVRLVDPCDPEPELVPMYEGDTVLVMTAISHLGIHTDADGDDGFLIGQRVVPTRLEGGKIYARPLLLGEHDDGRRVHARPGQDVVIEPQIELDYIDEWESRYVGEGGYVPLTPVLFTWLAVCPDWSVEARRYLLAAARRLDQAQALFVRMDSLSSTEAEGAPARRRILWELIGTAELAVVALGRAVDMCVQAVDVVGCQLQVSIPDVITSRAEAIREIRNAYEHIEDRAFGNVRGKPNADAESIFDHASLLVDGVVSYGVHRLDLNSDVPAVIDAVRQHLKTVAGSPLASGEPISPTTYTSPAAGTSHDEQAKPSGSSEV
ncbi:MAG: light-mediated development protein DET1 [Gordonia sp. (in: high G+C Gram-positive bacteria)]